MSPHLWGRRVLIIDDDAITLAMVQQTLASERYECLTTMNGAQGWAMTKQEAPDVVITDLLLPAAHGFQVLRYIKSDPQLRQTKVILMTASGSAQVRAEAKRLGADAYFDKPIDFVELLKTLQQLLQAPAGSAPPAPPTSVASDEGGMVLP